MAVQREWWDAISPYLDEALALSETDRVRWLESLRKRDAVMAEHLEKVFHEHQLLQEQKFLEQQAVSFAGELQCAGQCIGSYTLVSPIGQGGMGTVWLADRNDGRFQRRAAIKFLRAAFASSADEERFKREGGIVGRLCHPNIAELLDAGVTTNGAPYLILEYVEGKAIDAYCDEHRLDVASRLRLFLDVLAAVAHAHANLIVHRDIKPSNVLVREDGAVKLLDFGIAKLLEEDRSGATTLLTTVDASALTPAYAAPEQLTWQPITTATDVYSLGVLLYMLLCGHHPAGDGPHATAHLVKAIMDQEPPRMSDAAMMALASDVAMRRNTSAQKLRRTLAGDLDLIVAKSLKKDPQERYTSVTAFAEDIRRYLSDQPIRAQRDSVGYRTLKFARRNRTAVGFATVAMVAIIAGTTGTMVQARRAGAERDFAFRELSRAEAINDLDNYVLSNAAPSGKPLTVTQLLEGAEHILRRQQGDEITRTELLLAVGSQYAGNDQYAKARELLDEAYSRSRALPDPALRASAACSLGQVLSRGDDGKRAEALFNEGLTELPNDPLFMVDRVFCLLKGSEIAANLQHTNASLERARAAETLLQRSSFRPDALQLNVMIILAGAYAHAGLRAEADAAYRQTVERLQALGRDDTNMAGTLFNNWGTTLIRAGRPLDAERALHRAIEISRDGPGEETVTPMTMSNYAYVLYQLGRFDEASHYAEEGYAKAVKAGDTLAVNQLLLHRARISRAKGDLASARQRLDEVEPRLHGLPPGHIAFAVLDHERALTVEAAGQFAAAMTLINHAIALVETPSKELRGAVDYYGKFLTCRSSLQLQAGHLDDAVADAARALQMLQESSIAGSPSLDLGHAQLALARALEAQGKFSEARLAYRAAFEALRGAVGPDHPETRSAELLASVGQQQ